MNSSEALAQKGVGVAPLNSVPFDEMSRLGKHGSEQFGDHVIPYIFRGEKEFCSVRMFSFRMQKFWDYLNPTVYTYITEVDSFYITKNEVKLLQELNAKYAFGAYTYTTNDTIITLEDMRAFYEYLDQCYKILVSDGQIYSSYLGYTLYKDRRVLPFIMDGHEQVVPVNTVADLNRDFLNGAHPLKGWRYHQLKFLCQIQGLQIETQRDSVLVVELQLVKGCAQYRAFKHFWPSYSTICIFLDNIDETLKVGLNQKFFKNQPKTIDEFNNSN